MIKCPNCGSTAQVRLVAHDDLTNTETANHQWIFQHFECGCGCQFHVSWKKEGIFETIFPKPIDKTEEV